MGSFERISWKTGLASAEEWLEVALMTVVFGNRTGESCETTFGTT